VRTLVILARSEYIRKGVCQFPSLGKAISYHPYHQLRHARVSVVSPVPKTLLPVATTAVIMHFVNGCTPKPWPKLDGHPSSHLPSPTRYGCIHPSNSYSGFFSGFSLGAVFAEKIEFSWTAGVAAPPPPLLGGWYLYSINVVETECVKAGALRDTINWLKMANA
jgi:hypothetical protein